MASGNINSEIQLAIPPAVFPVFGPVSGSLPVQSTHLVFVWLSHIKLLLTDGMVNAENIRAFFAFTAQSVNKCLIFD